MIKSIVLLIPGMTWTIFIKLFVWMTLLNSIWFNTGIYINNTLFLWYITANSRYFTIFIFITSPQERSAASIPRTFDMTLHATKPIIFVQWSAYFWFHKWMIPYLVSLLFHNNSSASNNSFLLSNPVYSVQNMSWVTVIMSSDTQCENVLMTLLTCFLLSLY